ncbi:hypothetical protein QYF61_008830 [Mycteria americana]|uniref:Reverse transcriptase/retrotransposon-derived protein RNase H-like domain-containing protein n=1 Tax=Mycteria americana TaxID=33587 RepID=A0AAN7RX79_MYCAM|nr:hypothetical protein QYF61_008830 [Mycteria americana]
MFQYLKGGYKEDGDSLFTRSHMEKTRANGSKLLLGRFRLDTRGKFFTMRTISRWNNLPREVVDSPILDPFKIQLDRVLGNVVNTVLLPRKTALEQGEAPEHLQYIDDIILWGNTAEEVFEKAKKIVQILLKASFATKQTGENGLTWSLWQKAPEETRGRPLGFWSRGYRGSEARYSPAEKEILAAYEGVRAALEVVGTEAQLLLAPRLRVLGWMFKGRVPSTHHATDATWNAHIPKSGATEEHQNKQQVDQASQIEVAQVDLDWQHKGELFIAQWAHDTSGHQGRDAT